MTHIRNTGSCTFASQAAEALGHQLSEECGHHSRSYGGSDLKSSYRALHGLVGHQHQNSFLGRGTIQGHLNSFASFFKEYTKSISDLFQSILKPLQSFLPQKQFSPEDIIGLNVGSAKKGLWGHGYTNVRVIEPGQMSTMDFQPDRVNLYTDDFGFVSRVGRG